MDASGIFLKIIEPTSQIGVMDRSMQSDFSAPQSTHDCRETVKVSLVVE